jgi:Zn-dependent peptidase ImmA (M78 family)
MFKRSVSAASSAFVPARLVSARAARGLKQNQLADRVGRSPALISKWENDSYNHAPESGDLEALSSVLQVQQNWFFKSLSAGENASFFRSLRSELKSARDRSGAKLLFLHEISLALERRIEFPEVDIPEILGANDYKTLSLDQIDKIAERVREYWGLGDDPIDDLMTIIENAGVIVGDEFLVSSKLDGVSRWFDGRPAMLLAKDKGTGVRRRFDAAHELGHLILHRDVSKAQLKEDWHLIEDQAMAFASAFLMPSTSFAFAARDISLGSLANLKPTWKVSIAAMLMRLRSLNLIQEGESKNLWKYYSYRGWRGNEPHDDQIEIEVPVNMRSAIEMIVHDGPAEVAAFVGETGLSADDIASLTGVDSQVLGVVQERPKLRLVRSVAAANDG